MTKQITLMSLRLFVSLFLVSPGTLYAGDKERPNCKMVSNVWMKDGKRKLDVRETFEPSYNSCRDVARERQLASLEDEDVQKSKVVFGYKN